ncbi:unnamed protein product, partial [Ilex paraguariensis]
MKIGGPPKEEDRVFGEDETRDGSKEISTMVILVQGGRDRQNRGPISIIYLNGRLVLEEMEVWTWKRDLVSLFQELILCS